MRWPETEVHKMFLKMSRLLKIANLTLIHGGKKLVIEPLGERNFMILLRLLLNVSERRNILEGWRK